MTDTSGTTAVVSTDPNATAAVVAGAEGGERASSLTTGAEKTTATPSNLTPAEKATLGTKPAWAAASWTEDDQRQWDAKGFKDPNDVWKFAVNAQRAATAADRVALPKEGDDASLKAFHKAIGVPESADKYDIPMPEKGADPELAKTFKETAHKLGLTPSQAKELSTFYNGLVEKHAAANAPMSDEQFKTSVDQGNAELKREWGAQFDAKYDAASRALVAAGIDGKTALKIEETIGTAAMIRMFSNMGVAGVSGQFTAGGTSTGGMTKADAQTKINEIRGDSRRLQQMNSDLQSRKDTADTALWQKAHEVLAVTN
jgi:hypothetical protein